MTSEERSEERRKPRQEASGGFGCVLQLRGRLAAQRAGGYGDRNVVGSRRPAELNEGRGSIDVRVGGGTRGKITSASSELRLRRGPRVIGTCA